METSQLKKQMKTSQQELIEQNITSESILEIFNKQNPISINEKSIYKKDYESLLNNNWLRTQTINSLILILLKNHTTNINKLIKSNIHQINQNIKSSQILQQTWKQYFVVIDPFIVTMIMFTQHQEILITLKDLNLFNPKTKYLAFPINTQSNNQGKGSHWFLAILKNPFYQLNAVYSVQILIQLYILNSINQSQNGPSKHMTKKLSYKLEIMINLFHPQQKLQTKSQIYDLKDITKQSNAYDCGIFVIGYIQKLLNIISSRFQNLLKLFTFKLIKIKQQEKIIFQNYNQKDQIHSKLDLFIKSSIFLRTYYQRILEGQIYRAYHFQNSNNQTIKIQTNIY